MNKQKLIKFAKIIIQEYLSKDVPPVETITKIAANNKLSNSWISRLAEVVNVSLHNNIREKRGSSMIQFDLIDPGMVISKMSNGDKGKVSMGRIVAEASEVERGMAKAAAAEYYHMIDKEINAHNPSRMEKTASSEEKYDSVFREKTIEFQKVAKDILSRSSAMKEFLEERMKSNIMKLSSAVAREGYPNNIGYAVGSLRASAKNTFGETLAVDTIVDMIKVSSESIRLVKEPVVIGGEMNKSSSVYALMHKIIEDGKQANEYKKISGLMKTHNICKLANKVSELDSKMEKLSIIGGLMSKMVKNPLMGYFAYSDISRLPKTVREDVGAPEKEELGYKPMEQS